MNSSKLKPTRLFNRAVNRIRRVICRAELRHCGVLVCRSGQLSESIRIGSTVIQPPEAVHYLPSLKRWSEMLARGRFQVIADPGTSRLLLQREDKVVALPPIRTLESFLRAVILHWDSIVVDTSHNVRSLAGVTVEGHQAHVNYRGVELEYEVASNYWEESWEEVIFWGNILPNYYKITPPPQGGVVFDLGAYHGLFSMAAAIDIGPNGHVFCFEPDAQSRRVIELNCQRNKITTVDVIPSAVSGKTEKQSFVSSGGLGSHLGGGGTAADESVQVYSLPDSCKLVGISAPAFVKADIEGAEIEMVEEGLDWIKGLSSTVFSIASYHIVAGEASKLRLEQAFRKANYRVITTRDGHQTTVAWRS